MDLFCTALVAQHEAAASSSLADGRRARQREGRNALQVDFAATLANRSRSFSDFTAILVVAEMVLCEC